MLPILLISLGAVPEDLADAPAFRAADPTWELASRFESRRFQIGDVTIVRLTPWLETGAGPAPVEGADRVARLRDGVLLNVRVESPLAPEGRFVIGETAALTSAAARTPGSLIGRDAARIHGFARRVWLQHGNVQRPAWRVRVPTLRLEQLRDVWVDAESGAILRSRPVARFQSAAPTAARVFNPAPAPEGVSASDLSDVTLPDLLPAPAGDYLRGYHVETRNCCKHYTCPGGAPCDVPDRLCADAGDAGAIESTVETGIPVTSLPFDIRGPPINFPGETLFIRSVFCTERPRLTSVAGGWFPTPVDAPTGADAAASEIDAFVELELYWATRIFFEHMRGFLGPQFCLRDTSMACDTAGTAELDGDGNPVLAFHVSGNQLLPSFDVQTLLGQLIAGHGETVDDPLLVEEYQRLDNAAFVPALDGNPIQVPPELEPFLTQFNRPYDSNVYFQGGRDFGYDGDIVFHEFTHAVVWTLVPDLGSADKDRFGAHVETGALNEGWSDYFAASFTDDPLTGEYAGQGLAGAIDGAVRNADNTASCPNDIVGEVHEDSEPWSGALWEIREALRTTLGASAVDAFGELLLRAMLQADANETFALQAQRVIDELADDTLFGAEYASLADGIFAARGLLSCERVVTLVPGSPRDQLYQPAPGDVGLDAWVPSVIQFRVDAPAGSTGFELRWTQSAGGFGFGGDPAPPAVLINEGGPIEWQYSTTEPLAYDAVTGTRIVFDPELPANQAVTGGSASSFAQGLVPRCEPRSFWVSLVASESSLFQNIELVLLSSNTAVCATAGGDPDDGCGCAGAPASFGLVALLAMARRGRRR